MKSSYRENSYRLFFKSIVSIHQPKLIVECGILDGYSLFAMASSAKLYGGKVVGIDLFEDYEYNHASYEKISKKVAFCYPDTVELRKQNAYLAADDFEDGSIDMMHFDIANTGDRLYNAFISWFPKVKIGGTILFEGGSSERDKAEWMIKYNHIPIENFICVNLGSKFPVEYVVLNPFPSLTLCKKTGETL